jgi:hypothetical protein
MRLATGVSRLLTGVLMCGWVMAQSGPMDTQAKVTAETEGGPLQLKKEEQVALMVMEAIEMLEDDCELHAKHYCTMEELVARPRTIDGWRMRKLKFDPNKTDPNYLYKLTVAGKNWQASATPKKAGLCGFLNIDHNGRELYYNAKGAATAKDQELKEHGVEGDSFAVP